VRESLRGAARGIEAVGEHQFLAIFGVDKVRPGRHRHFGIPARDEEQIAALREKLIKSYGIELLPRFRCDFRDPKVTGSR
jgi:hypothetical protein